MYHLNSVTASSELSPFSLSLPLSLIMSYYATFSANGCTARRSGDTGEEGKGLGTNTQRVGTGKVWGVARFIPRISFYLRFALIFWSLYHSWLSFFGCVYFFKKLYSIYVCRCTCTLAQWHVEVRGQL